jgi:two-component system, LytTR family, response regulator
MLTIAIIEDDKYSIEVVKTLLLSQYTDAKIFTANSIETGINLFRNLTPDIALLDVELPDGLIFELLKQLNTIPFKIIFISGFNKYAIDAIKFSALDYLLKPIIPDELIATIQKAVESKEATNENEVKLIMNNFDANKQDKKLILKTSECVHIPRLDSIIRCEADWNYTTFYLTDKKKIMVTKAIKEYEELLGEYNFVRVHQSHLVNLQKVDHFDKRDGGTLFLVDGSNVPVSSRKKQQLLSELVKISLNS